MWNCLFSWRLFACILVLNTTVLMACQVNCWSSLTAGNFTHHAPCSLPEGLLHLCEVSYLHFLLIPAANAMCATDYLPVKFSPLHNSELLMPDNKQTACTCTQINHLCNPQPPESWSSHICLSSTNMFLIRLVENSYVLDFSHFKENTNNLFCSVLFIVCMSTLAYSF